MPPAESLEARFPQRARRWRLRTRELAFDRIPLLMGIVNVTPDSFSDGGSFTTVNQAVDHACRLVDDGADLLDLGGESTRPYSDPVSLEEELERVLPVLERLVTRVEVPLSIDTSKAEVAAAAVELGAEIINDVTGLSRAEMLEIARRSGAGVCAMHMRGTPKTMQEDPQYGNVVEEILGYLEGRREALVAAGIDLERICLDPGIGFGKTHQHNLTLMAACGRFHALGRPLLVGHSRKGFIGKVLGSSELPRDAGSLGAALSLAQQGIQVIRLHEVRAVREALALFAATGGIDGEPRTL